MLHYFTVRAASTGGMAEARIASARQRALAEIEDAVVGAAQAAAERLAGLKVSHAAAKSALRRAVEGAG